MASRRSILNAQQLESREAPAILGISSYAIDEGNDGLTIATVIVTLSAPVTSPVSVRYTTSNGSARAGVDYNPTRGTLVLEPGETSKEISVQVRGDTLREPDERFFVVLSRPTNATLDRARRVATVTITNDDPVPTLSVAGGTVAEGSRGARGVTFTVSLSHPSTQTVAVRFATQDGTATVTDRDYRAVRGTLRFAPGVLTRRVTVLVYGDTRVEDAESFSLVLSVPVNARLSDSQGAGVATIHNDDARPLIGITAPEPVAEGDAGTAALTFRITLSNAWHEPVSVEVATADGTATAADGDYVPLGPVRVTFTPGQTSKQVSVTVTGDRTHEGIETLFVRLTGPTNADLAGDGIAAGVITDDDQVPTVAAGGPPNGIAEGNDGTTDVWFSVTLSNPSSREVSVPYTTTGGIAPQSGTLTFAPGESTQAVRVPVAADAAFGPDRAVRLDLGEPTNAVLGTAQATAVVVNDDAPPVTPDTYLTDSDSILAVSPEDGLLANDADGLGLDLLTIDPIPATPPTHGKVVLSSDGGFTYTPDAGWHGTDSFTYRVTAGTASATGTVTITVVDAEPARQLQAALERSDAAAQTLAALWAGPPQPLSVQTRWDRPGTLPGSLGRLAAGTGAHVMMPPAAVARPIVYTTGSLLHVADSLTGRDRLLLSPHGAVAVTGAALSGDGTTVATIAGTTLVFTRAADGVPLRTVTLPLAAVSVGWIGTDAIVSLTKGTVRVAQDGSVTTLFPNASRVRFSLDGSVLGVSEDRFLTLYDTATLTEIYRLDAGYYYGDSWWPFTNHIWAYDPASGLLLVAGTTEGGRYESREMDVHNVQTGSVETLEMRSSLTLKRLNAVAVSPGGGVMAVGSAERNVVRFLHERADGVWVEGAAIDVSGVRDLSFAPDGSVFYVSGSAGLEVLPTPGYRPQERSAEETAAIADAVETVLSLANQALDRVTGDLDRISPSTFAASLVGRAAFLQEARSVLPLLPLHAVSPDQRQAAERLWRRLEGLELAAQTDRERIDLLLAASPGGQAEAQAVDRLLREESRAVDLGALQTEATWPGAVGTVETASGQVRLVGVGTAEAFTLTSSGTAQVGVGLGAVVAGIDFSQQRVTVTGVRLRFASVGGTPLVLVFRDGRQVDTLTPDADGIVHVRNPEGITDLVIRRAATAGVILKSLAFTSDPILTTVERRPLAPATNRQIALAVPPVNWGQYQMTHRPGFIGVDPARYSRVSVAGYSKDARIAGIGYYRNQNDLVDLDPRYITKLNDYNWIVHPGTPGQLYVRVSGATVYYRGSSLGYEWEYEQTVRFADSSQELIPVGRVQVAVDAFTVRSAAGSTAHGFLDTLPSELRGERRPVGREAVEFIATIRNKGGEAGAVLLEFFGVGWGHDLIDLGTPQRTVSVGLAPGGVKVLRTTVSFPGVTDEAANVVVRVTYPDGRTEVTKVTGTTPARNMSFGKREQDPETHQLTGNGAVINPYTAAEQERILRAHLRLANAFLRQGNTAESDRIRSTIPEAVSAGAGSGTIAASVRAQIESEGIAIPDPPPEPEEPSDVDVAIFATVDFKMDDDDSSDGTETQDAGQIRAHLASALVDLTNTDRWPIGLHNPDLPLGRVESVATTKEIKVGAKIYSATFELTGDSMVNVWLTNVVGMSLQVWKNGQPLHSSPIRGMTSGKSISAQMDAGDYEVYATSTLREETGLRPAVFHLEIKPLNQSRVEGRISREGSPVVHKVSLTGWKMQDEDLVPTRIHNDSPAWLVIHGRTHSESETAIEELTRALTGLGQQVITLDWSESANDNTIFLGFDIGRLEGSAWIERVASWAVAQLTALHVPLNKINLVGHSWGTYVSNSIAMMVGHVNTIIALDPASDRYVANLWGNAYKTETVNFALHSNHSLAIHSSRFGSASLARTANKTISLTYPPNYEGDLPPVAVPLWAAIIWDEFTDAFREHNFALTGFTAMLTTAIDYKTSLDASLLPLAQYASHPTIADDSIRTECMLIAYPVYDTVHGWKVIPDVSTLTELIGGNGSTSW